MYIFRTSARVGLKENTTMGERGMGPLLHPIAIRRRIRAWTGTYRDLLDAACSPGLDESVLGVVRIDFDNLRLQGYMDIRGLSEV